MATSDGRHDMLQGPNQFALSLRKLLEPQLAASRQLTELLRDETLALESGRADDLDRITALKPRLLAEIEQLVAEQSALLATAGFEASAAGLRQALQWCDNSGALGAMQDQLAEHLSHCSEQNSRNGVLVQFRIGFVRRALHSIRGSEFTDQTYGRDGRCGVETGRRLLGSG